MFTWWEVNGSPAVSSNKQKGREKVTVYFHVHSALAFPYIISHGHEIPVVSIPHAHLYNCAGHMVALFLIVYFMYC